MIFAHVLAGALLMTAHGPIHPATHVPIPPTPEPAHDNVAPPEPGPIPEPWASLAECETHGEWDYNEHSGWGSGIYDGGLQFSSSTWLAHGGGDFAPTADQATPHQQVTVAERVLATQGWKAWPACSLELGLR